MADRAALLDAAERLIAGEGPDVTMDAVARAAGVTKPIVYRGIGSKDDLVAALAERLVDRTNDDVAAAVAEAADPRTGLRRFVEAYLDTVTTHRNLYLFVTGGGAGEDWAGRALHLADRSARPIADQLAAARTAAGADPAVALTWAYGIVGLLHFVTLHWLRDPSTERDTLAGHITELLWSGLRGDPTSP